MFTLPVHRVFCPGWESSSTGWSITGCAGLVLTASILFHVVHATFFHGLLVIWPDKTDLRDAMNRVRRFFGKDAPLPANLPSIPLENKLYHGAIACSPGWQ